MSKTSPDHGWILMDPSGMAPDPTSPRLPRTRWKLGDLIVPLIAGACLSCWVFAESGRLIPPTIQRLNVYFQADASRVYRNLIDPSSNQYRAKVHPIFALLCGLPT